METLVAAGLFVCLMAAISYYGYRYYVRPGHVYAQLTKPAADDPVEEATGQKKPSSALQAIRAVGDWVPASPKEAMLVRRQLVASGYRSDSAVRVFYGCKGSLAAAFLFVAVLFQESLPFEGAMHVVGIVGAVGLGYSLPGYVLRFLTKQRKKRLRRSLPDALDLTVVCVEAGLGLDQAIASVSRELRLAHREICDELLFVTLEMQAGTRRVDALRGLAERTGVEDIRKLVGVLVQADRFGTSVGEALRLHSEFMRVKRRQEAEEKANKVAVKLVFPIFFFILPTIVLIAVGPAMLQIYRVLLPTMREMGQ